MNRVLIASLVPVLTITLACAAPAEEAGLTGKGTLRVATKIDEPGIGTYTDPSGAERAGIDIDIARYVTEHLGVGLQWEEVVSESREDMIMNGHTDLVIASYSMTDERKKKVAFAGPYLIVGQDIMIRAGDTTIARVEDLKDKGKLVCSAINSTSLGRLLKQYLIPESNVTKKYGYKECVQMLVDGRVDAVSTDDAILLGYANEREYAGKVRVLGQAFSEERYGIALARKWHADCERIVAILREMVDDGSWQRFVTKNLGGGLAGTLPRPSPDPSSCTGPS